MNELISVIVSTYERPDALAGALRGLSRQSDRRFEVVVADDGSGPTTAAMIDQWKAMLGVPLTHVRHEHRGFARRDPQSRDRSQQRRLLRLSRRRLHSARVFR